MYKFPRLIFKLQLLGFFFTQQKPHWCPQLDFRTPPGFDRTRNAEIGNKDIKFKHLEEAFTSEHWLVRIYKVKKLENREALDRKPRNVGNKQKYTSKKVELMLQFRWDSNAPLKPENCVQADTSLWDGFVLWWRVLLCSCLKWLQDHPQQGGGGDRLRTIDLSTRLFFFFWDNFTVVFFSFRARLPVSHRRDALC